MTGVRALLLAVASVLLAGPVSAGFARARWVDRMPTAATVLWQAICLASGLAMIEAGATIAMAPLGNSLAGGLARWFSGVPAHPWRGMTAVGVVCGALAVAAAATLLFVLIQSIISAGARRRAHRQVLDLLTGGRAGRVAQRVSGPDVRILDDPRTVAYTVPGWHARIVLSLGLVHLLDDEETAAVIEHERAHVRARHDLLVLPFRAWERALGRLPGVRQAGATVTALAEMMADDVAARRSDAKVLASALFKVALVGAVPAPIGTADRVFRPSSSRESEVPPLAVLRRVRRLDVAPASIAAVTLVAGAALALLALPVLGLLLPW